MERRDQVRIHGVRSVSGMVLPYSERGRALFFSSIELRCGELLYSFLTVYKAFYLLLLFIFGNAYCLNLPVTSPYCNATRATYLTGICLGNEFVIID
jgi:hypothetical protein